LCEALNWRDPGRRADLAVIRFAGLRAVRFVGGIQFLFVSDVTAAQTIADLTQPYSDAVSDERAAVA
jgi:hypothetical protein